jgi:hypothetical protein
LPEHPSLGNPPSKFGDVGRCPFLRAQNSWALDRPSLPISGAGV